MPESSTLKFSQIIDVPIPAVYHAFTNQAAVTQWLCNNALITAREGGSLFFNWNQPRYYAMGEFTRLEINNVIEFTWLGKGEPAQTKVQITLSKDNEATSLDLAHLDLGTGEEWADTRKQIERGWTFSLKNLKQVLEVGLDKRAYDQPFLGILISGVVSEEEAQQWDPDIKGGIRISGTLNHTGAAKIGLEPQDVIVRLGDVQTKDFPSLQQFVRNHNVGDTLDVVFFRDGSKRTAEMTFSARPAPDVPASPKELAEAMGKTYDQINQELDAIVSGLDEATAEYKSEEEMWCAKEILAHLVTNERALQMWISSMVDNQFLLGWPNNPQAWIGSVANTSSMAKLAEAFKKCEAETVELLSLLPEDTVSRKSTYYTIAENALNFFPSHTRAHFLEMQEAVKIAQTDR
jgi:uncharacterized protein YndB with AHSA1/START domain